MASSPQRTILTANLVERTGSVRRGGKWDLDESAIEDRRPSPLPVRIKEEARSRRARHPHANRRGPSLYRPLDLSLLAHAAVQVILCPASTATAAGSAATAATFRAGSSGAGCCGEPACRERALGCVYHVGEVRASLWAYKCRIAASIALVEVGPGKPSSSSMIPRDLPFPIKAWSFDDAPTLRSERQHGTERTTCTSAIREQRDLGFSCSVPRIHVHARKLIA